MTEITPVPRKQLNNITPFTYRDGYTFLQLMEQLRFKVNAIIKLTDDQNANINSFIDEIENAVLTLEAAANRVADIFDELQENGPVVAVDGQHGFVEIDPIIAGHINNVDSDVRGALTRTRKLPVGQDEILVNAHDYGVSPENSGADNAVALQAAIDATPIGGTLLIPHGDHKVSSTLYMRKPMVIAGGGIDGVDNGARRGSNLLFDNGITGLVVDTLGEGASAPTGYVRHPWGLRNIFFQSSATAGSGNSEVGFGIYARVGPCIMDNVTVERFANHGIYLIADGTNKGGGNLSMSNLTNVRVFGCWGDGIRMEGIDSNANYIENADVTANSGYGINLENTARVVVMAPHADQQYKDSPGAYRDNGAGNVWEHVYSEVGVPIEFGPNSSFAWVTTSQYARPRIVDNSSSTMMILDSQLGFRRRMQIHGTGPSETRSRYEFSADSHSPTVLALNYTAGSEEAKLVSAYYRNLDQYLFNSHVVPNTTDMYDSGSPSRKWRDVYASRRVHVNNAIISVDATNRLNVSTDGGATWQRIALES